MDQLILTNGDNAAVLLRQAGHRQVLPWRDVLHDGPVPMTRSRAELSSIRAGYLSAAFSLPRAEVEAGLAERDRLMARHGDFHEITLWFEHDLYDQLQLLQILAGFKDGGRRDGLYLVQAGTYLGELDLAAVQALASERRPLGGDQLALGAALWDAFRAPESAAMAAALGRDLSTLPFMAAALQRLLEELPERQTGLARSERQILEAIAAGTTTPKRLFPACQAMEPAKFQGDWSFWGWLEGLAFAPCPLVQGLPQRFHADQGDASRQAYLAADLRLTDFGRAVLEGGADHAAANPIDRWLGGSHLTEDNLWRWDQEAARPVAP
jgi:hypothetical protein